MVERRESPDGCLAIGDCRIGVPRLPDSRSVLAQAKTMSVYTSVIHRKLDQEDGSGREKQK